MWRWRRPHHEARLHPNPYRRKHLAKGGGLRDQGLDVLDVKEERWYGKEDQEILDMALKGTGLSSPTTLNRRSVRLWLVNVGSTSIRGIDMASRLNYKIMSVVGEESRKGNDAFEEFDRIVKEYIRQGWRSVGGKLPFLP